MSMCVQGTPPNLPPPPSSPAVCDSVNDTSEKIRRLWRHCPPGSQSEGVHNGHPGGAHSMPGYACAQRWSLHFIAQAILTTGRFAADVRGVGAAGG